MAHAYENMSDDDLLDLLVGNVRSIEECRRAAPDPPSGHIPLAPPFEVQQHHCVGVLAAEQQSFLAAEEAGRAGYRPLDSVWYGEADAELIEQLLNFYPHREPRVILDATVNGGRFWQNSSRHVIGIDIDPRHRPDICADNRSLPLSGDSVDVVVYDPPHIPNQGRDHSKDFNIRFGLGGRSSKENGYTFAHTYPAFMTEAWRVLANDGILLCKIADYVHNHRYQWAHVDLIRAGQEAGFTACDCIVKVRKGPIVDPKWKVAHHSRHQHCYWIVFRKSPRCE